MRDDALRRSGADPHRVAVVGHSAGGLMAWTMACSPSFGAEVVVSVAGTLTGPCPALPDPPVFLDLHGSADATVPVEGSDRVSPELGIAPPSVRTSLTTLARSAGCGPVSSGGGTTRHTGCRGGGIVQLTVFAGAGHEWRDLDASRHVFPFLARHLPGVR